MAELAAAVLDHIVHLHRTRSAANQNRVQIWPPLPNTGKYGGREWVLGWARALLNCINLAYIGFFCIVMMKKVYAAQIFPIIFSLVITLFYHPLLLASAVFISTSSLGPPSQCRMRCVFSTSSPYTVSFSLSPTYIWRPLPINNATSDPCQFFFVHSSLVYFGLL